MLIPSAHEFCILLANSNMQIGFEWHSHTCTHTHITHHTCILGMHLWNYEKPFRPFEIRLKYLSAANASTAPTDDCNSTPGLNFTTNFTAEAERERERVRAQRASITTYLHNYKIPTTTMVFWNFWKSFRYSFCLSLSVFLRLCLYVLVLATMTGERERV